MNELFRKFSSKTAHAMGTSWAFIVAVLIIAVWGLTGPIFGFSDTWQLVINTGTTIITFLMVFLIQNTQNRDAKAIHLKLDELIRSIKEARNSLVDAEDLPEESLKEIQKQFKRLREQYGEDDDALEALRDSVENKLSAADKNARSNDSTRPAA